MALAHARWLHGSPSLHLPCADSREPSSCKEHRRHVNRLPGGRCPAAQNSPIGTQPCVRHPSQWPAQIGDRRSPDTNDHAELPIVVPREAYRPAHKHALIRRARFGRIGCIGVVAALTCARWRRRSGVAVSGALSCRPSPTVGCRSRRHSNKPSGRGRRVAAENWTQRD